MALAGRRAREPPYILLVLVSAFWLIPTVTSGVDVSSRGSQPKCVSYCRESSKYNLQPGITYRYNYTTDLRTFANGASSQDSRVHFIATVEITAITNCEIQLDLQDVRFRESHPHWPQTDVPNSAQLRGELQTPLRFSWQDGKVEHLCILDEPRWALNMKRGILSVFQNTIEDLRQNQSLQESDINGQCLTTYEIQDDTQEHVIKRSKNLKSCSQRQSHVSAIQSVPYSSSSRIQNIPLLTGSQECVQTIRNAQLVKVECQEHHKFQPFEQSASAVTTEVAQVMTFLSSRVTRPVKKDLRDFSKSTLIFEPPSEFDSDGGNLQGILELLQALERNTVPKVTTGVPQKFIDLVTQLRAINYAGIATLFAKAARSNVSQTFILDALPLVGTAPALMFLREQFGAGKLTETQIDSWLTSLAFIKDPNLDMITAIVPMLDGQPRSQALLSVSSVIHAYCQKHDACSQETVVQEALRKTLSYLGASCRFSQASSTDLTRAIFALKALGNAGRLPVENDDRSFQLVQKCFTETSNPIEIRLAALDSFRRIPCNHYDQSGFIGLYSNVKEHTEVRIGAYLVSMKCPSRSLIDVVKDTLYKDSVNQVGSFVWTHLTNLQETASPDKQSVKELLSIDFLKNKFNTDARKYSRNYEKSLFWEDLNLGGGIDSNVIFTPDSFLPRQTTLNLTLHLFGESVNLFEIGGRIHSFEQLLESIFGPQGYFPEPHINQALNTVRAKRDTSSQTDRLGHVFNQARPQTRDRDRLPGGSAFLRVFGNEISYKHFEFSHKQTAPSLVDETGHNWLDITCLFDNLGTGKSTEWTKSSVIIDSKYVVPTGCGLPLALGLQAAATVGMKASGKIDLGNFWDQQEVDVHGTLEPSAAFQVDGHMTVHIGRANSKLNNGVKFHTTVHTATAVQARVLVKGNEVVHTSLTLPQAKQEILELKSELVLMSPSGVSEVVGSSREGQGREICTPDLVSTVTGLKLCGSAVIPEGLTFPPLSPTAVSVWVEKTDTITSYEFDYKWIESEARDKQDVSLLFNTPGSKVDRRVAVTYSLDMVQGRLEGSIETPRKSLMAQGHYSKAAQNLQLTLRSREEQILMVSLGLRKQLTRMEPHFLVSYYSRPLVDLQGVMYLANVLETDGKANFDLTLKHMTATPIQLTGELVRARDTYNARIGIESSLASGNIRSQVKVRPGLVTSKAEIQYSRSGSQKSLNFGGKMAKFEKGALVKYSFAITLTSPQVPHLNSDFSWELAIARGYCENNLKLITGQSRSVYEGKSLFKNQFRRQLEDIQFLLALTAPQDGMDYLVDFQHQKNQSGIFTQFTGRVDSQTELRASAEYKRTNEKLLRRNFNADISWPLVNHAFRSGVTEVRPGEYQGEVTIHANGAQPKRATGSYKNGSTKRRQEHAIEVRAENWLRTPISYSGKMTASERETYVNTQLEVEGRGRWGGSFEYSASKRYAHRMEAKVDLNGHVCSGEMAWRQARSGEQKYTADLHLPQNFYAELIVRDPYSCKLTVIPNKSFNPNDQLKLEGTVTTYSAKVQLDYFGESMTLAGIYTKEKIQLQAEIDSKRYMVAIDTGLMTVERFKVQATVETPMNGYASMGFKVDHVYNGNMLNSRIEGHLEGRTVAAAAYGQLDTPQSTFSVMMEASGMDKLVVVVKMSESGPTKLLELTGQKGTLESTLKAEVTNVPRSFEVKVQFSGCSEIPEISVELNHQKTSETTDTLAIRWTPKGSTAPKSFQARVTYLRSPLKVSFLVTTPWKNIDKVEGRLSIFQSDVNQELKLYLSAPHSQLPLNIELKRGGDMEAFSHSAVINWYQAKVQKSIQLSATGQLGSINQGELKISAKFPGRSYELDVTSNRNDADGLKIAGTLDYDKARTEIGFHWSLKSSADLKTSAWIQIPNEPKLLFEFAHQCTSSSYLLNLSVGRQGSKMTDVKVELSQERWIKWDFTAKFDSPWNYLPDVELSSRHDFTNRDTVRHRTEYRIRQGPQAGTQGVFTFDIVQGQLDSTLSLDSDYIHVAGQVDFAKIYLKAKGTTPLAPDYDVTFGLENYVTGRRVYLDLHANSTRLYHWQITLLGDGVKIHFDCPWGHVFEAEGKIDPANGLLQVDLKETKEAMITIKASVQLTAAEGRLHVATDSRSYTLLNKKKFGGKYSLSPNRLQVDAAFEDATVKNTVTAAVELSAGRKQLDVRVQGPRGLTYTVGLHDNSRLEGLAMHDGQKVFALTVEYNIETGDYSLGKHVLKGAAFVSEETYSAQAILGLDMSKILVHVNAPFEWKQFVLTGEVKQSWAILSLHKGEDVYKIKVHSGSGLFELEASTPWKGFQEIGCKIEYTVSGDIIQGTVHGTIDSSTVTLTMVYGPTQAEFDLTTPFEVVQKVLLATQWNMNTALKSVQVTAAFNKQSQLVRGLWELSPANGHGQLTLGGDVAGRAEFKYDTRSGYNGEGSIDFSGRQHQVAGQLVIDPTEIRIELHTPFDLLKNFGAKISYPQPMVGSRKIALDWNWNGHQDRMTADVSLSDTRAELELRTPLPPPWNLINTHVAYGSSGDTKTVEIQFKRSGREEFHLRTEFVSKIGKTESVRGLKSELRSSIEGWDQAEVNVEYKSTTESHQLSIDLSKSVDILKSTVTMTLPAQPGDPTRVQGSLALPLIPVDSIIDISFNIDQGKTGATINLTLNGVEYSGDSSFLIGSSTFKIEVRSSFAPVRNFVAAVNFARLSDTALSLRLNEKVIELKLQGSYSGMTEFKVNCDITTPFEGYRRLHGEAHFNLKNQRSSGSFQIQNDKVRYQGKLDGRLGSDSGEVRLQFNSPLYNLENVIWTLKFEQSKVMLRLERNTQEDFKVEGSMTSGQLVLGVISNLPGYTFSSRSLVQSGTIPISAQIHLDSENLNIKANLQGYTVGTVELRYQDTVRMEWLLEGGWAQGNAKLAYVLPVYGQRSFRSSWKHDQFKNLEGEFWWSQAGPAEEKGLAVEYSVENRSGTGKFSGSVSYVGTNQPQALKVSMSVKTVPAGASLIDLKLKTPFSSMEDLNLSGKLVIGREIGLDLTSTLNRQPALTLSSTLVTAPMSSKLKVVFNAPAVSEPFTLAATYDLATTDKFVELFFAQHKYKLNVKAQALVSKENPQEIELRMSVDSNIPSVTVSASASLRAGYKIESDGTRQVTLAIDSQQTGNWRGVASIRPLSDFKIMFRLESPIPEVIPSVKTELGWQRNSGGFSGSLLYQLAANEVLATVGLTPDEFKMTITSWIAGLDDILVLGKVESGEGTVNKKVTVDLRVAGKQVTLSSNLVIPTKQSSMQSSIQLVSSWDVIPSGSMEARLDTDGRLSISGKWGQRSVEVRGTVREKLGGSVWEAAEVSLTLSMDSSEVGTLKSYHFLLENQYSWNVSVGQDLEILTFLEQGGDRSVFSGQIKWNGVDDGLILRGESSKRKITASFNSPWASEIEVSAQYKVDPDEYSADGFVTYDGVKSGLRAEVVTKQNAIAARITVDVPVLGQKLDAKIHLQLANPDNVVGILEMSMGDRRLSVKGSLVTSQYSSNQLGPMVEQLLKMSMSLPRSDYIEIQSEWSMRRPLGAWYNAEVSGSLTSPKGTHKAAFRYHIPTGGHSQLAADWFLDSTLVFPDVLKGSIEVEQFTWDDFSGRIRYNNNELKASWSAQTNLALDVSANVPSLLQESSPVRIVSEGTLDAKDFRLKTTVSVNKDSSTVELSCVQSSDGFNARVYAAVPIVASEPFEIGFKFRDVGSSRTVMNLLGSYGQESFGAQGEFVSTPTTVSMSFKTSGSYGTHFAHVAGITKSTGYLFEINAESQSLFKGKKITVTGTFAPTPSGITATAECRTKQGVHGVSVNFDFDRTRGQAGVKFDSPLVLPMRLDLEYIISYDKVVVKVAADGGNGKAHSLQMSFDRRESQARFYMKCPMVHPEPISAHARGKIGPNQLSLIGELDLFGNRARAEGTLRCDRYTDMELKFELVTPFRSFDRVTVAGKLNEASVEIEFQSPVPELTNFMIKSNGINYFGRNDFHNFHPQVVVRIPLGMYSAGGAFQLPTATTPGKFGGYFEHEYPNDYPERYDVYVHLSPYETLRFDIDAPVRLTLDANSPIEGYRHLQITLGGNVVWRQWGNVVAEASFNDHKLSLVSQLKHDSDSSQLNVVFRTPFNGYEQFGLHTQIQRYEEIGTGHNIHLEWQQPGWANPVVMEIDYRLRYNGLVDMEGEFKLIPEWVETTPLLLTLKSDLKELCYTGVLEGSWGSVRPILKLTGSLTSDTLAGSIEGKAGAQNEFQIMTKFETVLRPELVSMATELTVNYHQVALLSVGMVRHENRSEGEFRLKTPFRAVRSFEAIYRLSPTAQADLTLSNLLNRLDVAFGVSHNDRKVVHFELVNQPGRRVVEVHNPLRPISLAMGYDLSSSSSKYVMAEVCWNLTNAPVSTIGLRLGLTPTGVTLKVRAGSRGFIDLGVAHWRTNKNLEQSLHLRWNHPQGEAGYQLKWSEQSKMSETMEDFKLRLDFPWRSIQLERQTSSGRKESRKSLLVRWDMKRDPTKVTGYTLTTTKSMAWRSSSTKQFLTVTHSAFPHDLTVAVDRRYANGAWQAFSIVFQPNPFPRDTLTFDLKRDGVRNKELRVAMTHPATNVDIIGHYKQDDNTMTLYLSHVDMAGVKQLMNLEVSSDTQGTFVDISTAAGSWLKFEYKPTFDKYHMNAQTRWGDMTGDYVFVPPLLKASAKLTSGQDLSVTAGLPHTKELSLRVTRTHFGMTIRDILVSLKLNTSEVLSTQVHWRPELRQELHCLLLADLPVLLSRLVMDEVPKALVVLNDEIEDRLVLLDPSVSHGYIQLKRYTRHEVEAVLDEIRRVIGYVRDLHARNTLHTQYVLDFFNGCVSKLWTTWSDTIESVTTVVTGFWAEVRSWFESIKEFGAGMGYRLERALMLFWDKIEQLILTGWTELGERLQQFVNSYSTIGHLVNGNLNEVMKAFRNLGIVQKILNIYQDYCDWWRDVPVQEYMVEGYEMFREMVVRPIELSYQPYLDMWRNALESGNLRAILDLPPVPYLKFITTRVLGLANKFWLIVEAEQRIKSFIGQILARVDILIQSHIPISTLIWDVDKGHIEYHQPLTFVEWTQLNEWPRFKQPNQSDFEQTSQIQKFYIDVLDTMRTTRPLMELDVRDILPPFVATAIIAADHHFLTFDGTYYRFSGECSYILMSDLMQQNLTLTVNYENDQGRPRKTSYTLLTSRNTVQIDTETLAVTIDGLETDLPVTIGPMFIRRQRSGLEILDTRGFQMRCSQLTSVCRVSVSGWYFGKLGGLLGNYDNEKSNDLRTPDGTVITDVANFAHSWRVGGKSGECQMKNYENKTDSVAGEQSLCHQMLNMTSSPLRPCFTTVDVGVFKEMCQYDMKYEKGERNGRICPALAAYVMSCQQHGIDIWMPPQCVKCQQTSGAPPMRSGDTMTFSPETTRVPSSADVVFLIEEASSLRDYDMSDTVKKLEAALRAEGIVDNRYAIVGFGGQGARAKPHLRTSSSAVWTSMNSFKISDVANMNGGGAGNLYDAINFAATIGYRAGVSKTMVAIVAGQKQCEDNVKYSDTLTLLLENDIRLHILTPEEFSLKVDTKQDEASKVLGIDLDGVFTTRQAVKTGPVDSDRVLRRQIKIPKDLCTPLAMETTGTLFNLRMLHRPAVSKKFVDIWTRRVASTSKPSSCQLCDCLPDRDGGSVTMCHQCVSPNLQKFIDDLNKFEQNPDGTMSSMEVAAAQMNEDV